jgi:tRNA dimethylallyltransferase
LSATNQSPFTLIVIAGPTAVGKTAIALRIASLLKTSIISTDSRQFYREMNAATAKPSVNELASVPHHFINSLSIHDTYSAGQYERDSIQLLAQLFNSHSTVVAVGGSGLYIQALVEGLDTFPDVPDSIQQDLQDMWEREGLQGLKDTILREDPDYAAEVDMQNPRRLIRALGVTRTAGIPYSQYRINQKTNRPFKVHWLRLSLPRDVLYDRINSRVDTFFQLGWLEEIERFYPFRHLKALQTVGYSEMFDHLEGKIDFQTAVEKVRQHSRNYAKRQETWLRKHGGEISFNPSDWEGIMSYLLERNIL